MQSTFEYKYSYVVSIYTYVLCVYIYICIIMDSIDSRVPRASNRKVFGLSVEFVFYLLNARHSTLCVIRRSVNRNEVYRRTCRCVHKNVY